MNVPNYSLISLQTNDTKPRHDSQHNRYNCSRRTATFNRFDWAVFWKKQKENIKRILSGRPLLTLVHSGNLHGRYNLCRGYPFGGD